MSATLRVSARPWAAAHRAILLFAVFFVVIVAAAITVPLVVLRSGAVTPAPATAPAHVVRQAHLSTPSDPCELATMDRSRPC